jgi:RNA polymerase sigma factor (sigma-70 family)
MGQQGGGVEVAMAIEALVCGGSLTGLTESELLARFVQGRDPRALEVIVSLHGPMVLAVCRQLLSDPNDIEDVFQATFLVLIRKGSSIRQPGSLGSWLYGVAYRTARRLRRTPRPLRLVAELAEEQPPCPIDQFEQREALHREISRLPEKYRQPIVLCYLEGLTHDAAAARLSWPVGTVRGRLARARDRLRKQLTSGGVYLSAGFLDVKDRAGLHELPLTAARTQSLVGLLDHYASSRVTSLAQGAIAAMLTEKLKWIAIAVVTPSLVLLAAGTALVAGSKPRPQGNTPGLTVQSEAGEVQKANANRVVHHVDDAANKLESDKVEAEVLEMETHALQVSLERLIAQTVSLDRPVQNRADNANQQEQAELFKKRVQMRVEELRETYRHKRLELATLKRQIAREGHGLGLAEAEPLSLTEMSQRLRALETKVDRILEAVSRGGRGGP